MTASYDLPMSFVKAIASRLAIALRLEAIALRLEAIATIRHQAIFPCPGCSAPPARLPMPVACASK